MRYLLTALALAILAAGAAFGADHPPVGAIVTAKDNGKAYRHVGNGQFVPVDVPKLMPGCTSCDDCKCKVGDCPQKCPVTAGDSSALAAVNAKRAAKGLPPYQYDPALTAAAQACASHRANARMFGHTSNDFAFLPPGARADATGCAAYPASYGFMACAIYDNYRYAGAAMVPGSDGKVYCHLFVSHSPSGGAGYVNPNPAALPQGVYYPQQGCVGGSCGLPSYAPPRGVYYLPQSCPNGNCRLPTVVK